jgi:radical SAM protein with 4Fe4S-binding SPASM domain
MDTVETFRKIQEKKLKMKKRFKKVYVEITNRCNLQCAFCASSKSESRFITLSEFRHIAGQVRPFSDYIYLHVLGEPLLHPALGAILDIAENERLKVNLTTNGTLLGKWVDDLMNKPALRQINISMHSKGGSTESGPAEAYIESILKTVKKLITGSHVIVSIRLWNISQQNKESSTFNKVVIRRIHEVFPEWDSQALPLKGKEGYTIAERLYLNTDQVFTWPNMDAPFIRNDGFCYGLKDQLAVLADGTVVPCCLDCEGVINLGNIYQQSLEEIMTGERALKITEGFSRRHLSEELCRRCSFRTRFDQKKHK